MAVASTSSHVPTSSVYTIEKSENVISKAKMHSTSIYKSILDLQFTDIEKDFKVKELMEYLEIKKKRMLELQMQNENLSQDITAELDHRSEILSLIMCQCQGCEVITCHMQNLNSLGEQLTQVKQELLNQNMENTKDMCMLEHYIKSSFQEEDLKLFNAVKEKLHQLQAENVKASSQYDEIIAKITETKLKLEATEKEWNLMISTYAELLKQGDEEGVVFKKEENLLNGKLTSFISKNKALGESINNNINGKNGLEKQLKQAIAKRNSIHDTAKGLENAIREELNKQKDLIKDIEEFDRNIAGPEEEVGLKHMLLQQKKNEKEELEKQVQERDKELQVIHRELQEAKEINHTLDSGLNNLNSKIKNADSTLLSLEEDHRARISEMKPILESLIEKIAAAKNEASDCQNAIISLKGKVGEEMEQNKLLQKQGSDLKKEIDEGAVKIKNLQISISEKEAQKDQMKIKLEEQKAMVEKIKYELENMNKLHKEYESAVEGSTNEVRQKTAELQEKREKFESEMNEKRKSLMEHLDECRNDTLKLTNAIEAELTEEKKEISNLKEKLQDTVTEMESMKKAEFTKKCTLVNKIKQLENEFHLETQAKAYKNYLESPASLKSRNENQQKSQEEKPLPAKKNQRKFEDYGPTSESDQSVAEISIFDLMKMTKNKRTTPFTSRLRTRSTTTNSSKKPREKDILDLFGEDYCGIDSS